MLIFFLVFIGLSILIIGHEAGHFFAAKLFKMRVDEFGFGFPPRILARKKGETEYSLNWLPFGGFVKIAGEKEPAAGIENALTKTEAYTTHHALFYEQPAWRRSIVIAAGVTINFIIGWFIFASVFMIGAPSFVVISNVEENSPAAHAGFMSGDIVKNYKTTESLILFINEHRGEEITLEISRGGNAHSFSAIPRSEVTPQQGALGVELIEGGMPKEGFFTAFIHGFTLSIELFVGTCVAFADLITNLVTQGSLLEGVVGPVGIFSIAQQTGEIGLIFLLQLLGIISINLTVVNLIPFPALDGGRLFIILIEKIKGSSLPHNIEGYANIIGFVLLIGLMILLTIRDIAAI